MNIHLLTQDIWFYLTLLLLTGYIIQVVLVGLLIRKFPMLKSIKATRKYTVSIDTVPTPAVPGSSLREKLNKGKTQCS